VSSPVSGQHFATICLGSASMKAPKVTTIISFTIWSEISFFFPVIVLFYSFAVILGLGKDKK
jgi:ABC-type transport system involved in multi-copper enzyme maturation permease subunit